MEKRYQHRGGAVRIQKSSFDEAREEELGGEGGGVEAAYVLQGHRMDHQHKQEVPGIKSHESLTFVNHNEKAIIQICNKCTNLLLIWVWARVSPRRREATREGAWARGLELISR